MHFIALCHTENNKGTFLEDLKESNLLSPPLPCVSQARGWLLMCQQGAGGCPPVGFRTALVPGQSVKNLNWVFSDWRRDGSREALQWPSST